MHHGRAAVRDQVVYVDTPVGLAILTGDAAYVKALNVDLSGAAAPQHEHGAGHAVGDQERALRAPAAAVVDEREDEQPGARLEQRDNQPHGDRRRRTLAGETWVTGTRRVGASSVRSGARPATWPPSRATPLRAAPGHRERPHERWAADRPHRGIDLATTGGDVAAVDAGS